MNDDEGTMLWWGFTILCAAAMFIAISQRLSDIAASLRVLAGR